MSKRNDDLKKALASPHGVCQNGNHLIKVIRGPEFPDTTRCLDRHQGPCDLWLSCQAQHCAQAPHDDISYPCRKDPYYIEFYYFGSLIITYDVNARQIIDHDMRHYSVTTARAWTWYVSALTANGFNHDRPMIHSPVKRRIF